MRAFWASLVIVIGLVGLAIGQVPNTLYSVIVNSTPASVPLSGTGEYLAITQGGDVHRITPSNLISNTYINPTNFGLSAASSDNTTAINDAMAAAAAGKLSILFPSGTFNVAGQPAITFGSSFHLNMIGAGSGNTILNFTGASTCGFLFTGTAADNAVSISGMTLQTTQTNCGSAITMNQTGTSASTPPTYNAPASTFDNLRIIGSDWPSGTRYWSKCFDILYWSNITTTPLMQCQGSATQQGIGIATLGSSSKIGVIYNLGGNWSQNSTSMSLGIWTQGYAIPPGTNITNSTLGIIVNDGTGVGQLAVIGSQIATFSIGIKCNQCFGLMAHGNYFLNVGNGSTGIYLPITFGDLIVGNTFIHQAGTTGVQNILIDAETVPARIANNSFIQDGSGIVFSSQGSPTNFLTAMSGNVFSGLTVAPVVFGTNVKAIKEPPLTQTVATLPTCDATTVGRAAFLSDGNSVTWGSNVSPAGASSVQTVCDGTNWTVAAK